MNSSTYKIRTGCGNMYITIGADGKAYELFTSLGKAGTCAQAQVLSISSMINLAVNCGKPLSEVSIKLSGISCASPSLEAKSCADAISIAIKRYIESENGGGNASS